MKLCFKAAFYVLIPILTAFFPSKAFAGLSFSNNNLSLELVRCSDNQVNNMISDGILASGNVAVSETTENTGFFKFNYPRDADHQNLKAQLYIYNSSNAEVAKSGVKDLHSSIAGFISQYKSDIPSDSYYTKIAVVLRSDNSKGCILQSESTSISRNSSDVAPSISVESNPSVNNDKLTATVRTSDDTDVTRASFSIFNSSYTKLDIESSVSVNSPVSSYNSDSSAQTWGYNPSSNNTSTAWDIDISGLADGNYFIMFYAADGVNDVVDTGYLSFSKSGDDKPSISVASNPSVSNDKLTATVRTSDDTDVTRASFSIFNSSYTKLDIESSVSVNSPVSSYNSDSSAQTWGYNPSSNNTSTAWDIDISGLADGNYFIMFYAADGVNDVVDTGYLSFSKSGDDKPSISVASNPSVSNDKLTATVRTSDDTDVTRASFSIFNSSYTKLDIESSVSVNSPVSSYNSDSSAQTWGYNPSSNNTSTAWDIDISGLADGNYFIMFYAADGVNDVVDTGYLSFSKSGDDKPSISVESNPSVSNDKLTATVRTSDDTDVTRASFSIFNSSYTKLDIESSVSVNSPVSSYNSDSSAQTWGYNPSSNNTSTAWDIDISGLADGNYFIMFYAADGVNDVVDTGYLSFSKSGDDKPSISVESNPSVSNDKLTATVRTSDDTDVTRASFSIFNSSYTKLDIESSVSVNSPVSSYNSDSSAQTWGYNPSSNNTSTAWDIDISGLADGNYFIMFYAADGVNDVVDTGYLSFSKSGDDKPSISVNITGQGKVLSLPTNEIDCGSKCSHQFESNTQITLVASAAKGWEFSSWSYQPTKTSQCTTAACTLVIKEDLTLTAVFVEQEEPATAPRLIDFTPKRAQAGSSTSFTLIGENLPKQLIANIQGTLGHCTAINHNESSATLACTPDAKGVKRFYIKDANNRSKSIAGSEHWYVEVTPSIQSSAPSVWIDNLPDYAILNEQFTITVKSEDVDGDLLSIQADWEGDNNLDRKVNVSNAHGQDVTFSYTRINNDLSDLTLKFIATDASGNESIFTHTIPVVQLQELEKVVSGYEGADKAVSTDGGQCVANPIMPSNGAKVEHKQLLAVHGVVPITFDISYNSLIRGQSGIGVGWDFANAYAAQIAEAPNGDVTILWSDNQQHKFSPKGGGTYNTESFGCRLDKLAKLEDGTFKVERRNRLTYVFNEFNFLTRIENHKGQGINFEFDDQSRLIKAYDPVSNVGINYRYNQDGFLVEAISTAGRTVYLNYENEQLTKITHADGTVEEFTYNDLDQIVDHLLDSVLISTTTYDNKGRAVEQEDSRDDNQPLRLAYQETDEYVITTITDRNGRITQKTFDKNYQLVKESNALSHEQSFVYNEDGKPTLITNGRGYSLSMAYTEFGDITKLVTPDNAEDKKEYDVNRNMVKHINALEEETLYRYVDGTNNLESVKNALGLVTSFTYNADNQKLSVTTPEGRTTSFGYTNGLLSSVTNPEGHTRHIYYDLDGYVESETDFLGNTTTYERDGLGRVTRKEDPLGFFETWVYDGRGNVLEYADKRYNSEGGEFAGKIQNSYNGQGDLLEKRWVSKNSNKLDVVYSYKYDGESRLIESTDPNGNVTLIERDAIGRVMNTTDALGNKVEVEFDKNGNLIESKDAKGNISKAMFDEMDRTTQTEDAAGNKHAFAYNLLGQITKTTNALSQVWQNAYDKLSRLVSVTHPNHADEPLVAKQGYDGDNNITSITVPAGDIRTLALNNNALVETETTADSVALQYSYNENGLVSTFINGRGQQTSYKYDAGSRLTSITDPISTISYGYDQNANPTSVTENDITISRFYDHFNRVAQYKQNDNNLRGVNFLRDVAGNLEQVEYTNNNGNTNLPIKYTYNALNRITSVSGLNQEFLASKYEYDANQNITKVIRGNGTVLENTYDNLNRLISSIDKAPDESIILEQHYTYNAIGQVIKEDVTPEYAPPIELISAQAMTYTEDNRIETKNTDETFTFDGDGNTLNVGDLALSFNARNQLISADDHKYTYNAESMRDSLTYSVGNDVTQIRYALLPDYLGLPQIAWQEVTNPDDSVDYHYFIYSPYGLVSQHTSKANQVAQDYYFHYDYRGSVVAISDKEGEVVARYGYTPFGKRFDAPGFEEQNQAITTPFGYNGRDGVITDNNSLIYMRARYYSPELRRFVSKDPIRGDIDDLGSLNRYAYVGGDPINLVDPSGLTPQKADSMYELMQLYVKLGGMGAVKVTKAIGPKLEKLLAPKPRKEAEDIVPTFSDELLNIANNSSTTVNASTRLHKNNNDYIGEQTVYQIRKNGEAQSYKEGTTANKKNAQGFYIRPQQQVNSLNKNIAGSPYYYVPVFEFWGSTGTCKAIERTRIKINKDVFGECSLNKCYH
ncbi:RHS repeat-associated core domain-containing protein [Pseudoalteromonas viridis]|uniref:RHS repeat-associated core domain-containing protein n=1 Tax=Pseudoalteromonas viridis TaxID=339617 RepID=A0ABX7V9J9_9GAMM|nr:RHS repeat-associated core domain-containing protein [Pseudoalteromonas viridis]QTL37571.1 RHS repeat-associated core domain-containing protein [Pseudoalteromonas viridis]